MQKVATTAALLAAGLLLCLSQTARAVDAGSILPGSPANPTSAASTLRGGFSSSLIAARKPQLSAKFVAARDSRDFPPELRVGSSNLDSIKCGLGFQLDVASAFTTGQAEPEDLIRAKVLSATFFCLSRTI
jgi:hypothetical protein